MEVLKDLKPERVFYYFEELCKIPHGSKNTKEISDYLVSMAKENNLEWVQDNSNNVIIRKPASPGYEKSSTVILQGHMDMVCEKKQGSNHDFEKDGLSLEIDGDFVTAKDTTLGGDDGIAVAYCLAIMEDDSLAHPPLEMVLTVDEEIGLLGAGALDYSQLKGKTMINIDSEEEGIFFISCAGGMRCNSELPVRYVEARGILCDITIDGLVGGHSGSEIDKYRANGNILMGRVLYRLKEQLEYYLTQLKGGGKDNAIPRGCQASILVSSEDVSLLEEIIAQLQGQFEKEFQGIEENLKITVTIQGEETQPAVHPVDGEKIVFYLMHVPNGVLKMSGVINHLVETSSNLGIMKLTENSFCATSAPRSSVESARDYVAEKIQYLTEFLGGDYHATGIYPAWEYKKNSRLQKIMVDVYEKCYGEKPRVEALHAGLECGLFYEGIEGLDCISMGPDMQDIHTTEERMSISSVQRTYKYLLEVLKALK